MLQRDVAEAGRAMAGRVRERGGGDESAHGGSAGGGSAGGGRDGRSLEDRAHAALSSCPRFVLLDFKCAQAILVVEQSQCVDLCSTRSNQIVASSHWALQWCISLEQAGALL